MDGMDGGGVFFIVLAKTLDLKSNLYYGFGARGLKHAVFETLLEHWVSALRFITFWERWTLNMLCLESDVFWLLVLSTKTVYPSSPP